MLSALVIVPLPTPRAAPPTLVLATVLLLASAMDLLGVVLADVRTALAAVSCATAATGCSLDRLAAALPVGAAAALEGDAAAACCVYAYELRLLKSFGGERDRLPLPLPEVCFAYPGQ